MKRPLLLLLFLLSLCSYSVAQEKKDDGKSKPATSALDELKAAPNDPKAWGKYMSQQLPEIMKLAQTDQKAAEKKLAEVRIVVESIKPDQPTGQRQAQYARTALDSYEDQIVVNNSSLEELTKQLEAAPDEVIAIRRFVTKVGREIGPLSNSEPEKADARLKEIKAIYTAAKDKATSEEAKKLYASRAQMFSTLESAIQSGLKLLALVGKDATPLKVDAWVNGEAISDAELKGKVVLLDFWAIWCGPCIATFPHLREWNEKYEKKGLVMIGLTNYYGFEWDEAASRAKKAAGEVTHEQEHEMLKKFAAHHKLTHRFGLQSDKSAAEYYGVAGIPHVVVIDQAGKVRLVRVGSGEKNAKDISDLLEKLLGGEKVAGN